MTISATENFGEFPQSMVSPLTNYVSVSPSDTDQLPFVARSILIGTDGTIAIVQPDGTEQDFPATVLAVGIWHPMRVLQIMATNTTATNIWVGE